MRQSRLGDGRGTSAVVKHSEAFGGIGRYNRGSNVVIDKIDLCRSRKGKDFGCGFYLNPNKEQAMEMAVRTSKRMQEGEPIVNAYLFDDSLLSSECTPLSVKLFEDYSLEWAEFILI